PGPEPADVLDEDLAALARQAAGLGQRDAEVRALRRRRGLLRDGQQGLRGGPGEQDHREDVARSALLVLGLRAGLRGPRDRAPALALERRREALGVVLALVLRTRRDDQALGLRAARV